MRVCIAEKPSVAKEIAEILGAKTRRDGFYEGNGYQVTWTFGHLCTLKEPHDYLPQWKRWSLFSLPMLPNGFGIKVINNSGVQKQFSTIKTLIEQCDEVINCGDAGIEGEVIQRWVLAKAKNKKPLKRLWISSLTEEAIREGFENLKEGSDYDLLYAAGNSRAVGDWLLGMNATRLYTLKYANNKGVLSIGRVQTPTLALIVERQKEIDNFVPQTYWELKTKYRDVTFSMEKGRFDKVEDANEVIEKIKEDDFTITSFSKKKGKEAPPKLLDLTSLQVEANKKYGMSAEDTLGFTQKLYEKKLLTYPRVDTTFLPNDMYPKIPQILDGMKPYAAFTGSLLGQKIKKSKKVFDDKKVTDHHAIIPTGVTPTGMSMPEKQIYDLVARRFIAAFYPDCIVSNTTVLGEAAEVKFKATGKQILEDGWRILFPKKSGSKEGEEAQLMPAFEEGEKGPHEPFHQEKQTQPPKLYTEATLLRAMETAGKQVDDEELRDLMKENGIGRPSTRANIIETLFKRKYIERSRKNLVPTQTGVQLIDTIHNELLKSAELTGLWEQKLRQIEKGEYQAKVFIEEMKTMVSELVQEVMHEQHKSIYIHDEEKEKQLKEAKAKAEKEEKKAKKSATANNDTCPKCKKGKIVKGKSAFGCTGFKDGCDFRMPFEILGKKLTDKQVFTIIQKGKSGKIKGFKLNNEKVSGKIVLNSDFVPEFEPEEQKEKKSNKLTCPKCKEGEMLRGKTAYGCSRFKEGCKMMIPFDRLQAAFGDDTLTQEILKRFD